MFNICIQTGPGSVNDKPVNFVLNFMNQQGSGPGSGTGVAPSVSGQVPVNVSPQLPPMKNEPAGPLHAGEINFDAKEIPEY